MDIHHIGLGYFTSFFSVFKEANVHHVVPLVI